MSFSIDDVKARLEKAFAPVFLEVVDASRAHESHYTLANGSPSHLTVRIQAPYFDGLKPVEQHQAIYALFTEELRKGTLHALSIEILLPSL